MRTREIQDEIRDLNSSTDLALFKTARIIGCTTTGAAKYKEVLKMARPTVVMVEEAGELQEAHTLTSLGSTTKQLIMVGQGGRFDKGGLLLLARR